jgi:DNA segregation ATPase FtsK/SpoIIIE-like protein
MNASTNDEHKALLNMTAETIGKDLLSMMVLEMKMLPDAWSKLSQSKQDDVIERFGKRIDTAVRLAVHTIASGGRIVVAGDLDKITISDGVQAVIKFGVNAPNLHQLYDATKKAVLVVVADASSHLGGMDDVKGDSDQLPLPADDAQGDVTILDGDGNAVMLREESWPGNAEDDPKFAEAVRWVVYEDKAGSVVLARALGLTVDRASSLLARMESEGIVSAVLPVNGRKVLWSNQDLQDSDYAETL